jgi:uncharacterized membrane protein
MSSSVPTLLPRASLVAAAVKAEREAAAGITRPRLDFIDVLRGAVIALMVLDHARDFLGASAMNPRDVSQPALFLTRWVTHFCAPVFVFLSGVSAHLYGARGRSLDEIRRFLWTRGLWMILLELTIVRVGWTFDPRPRFVMLQVIWAIGWSMLTLAAVIKLPHWLIGVLGLAVIAGHNLLDFSIHGADLGVLGGLWSVLHQAGVLHPTENSSVFVVYPLIPWIGVMAVGYALGPVLELERRQRTAILASLGMVLVELFVLLRWTGWYGDPVAWASREGPLESVLAFLDCEKYPPSLLYLCMTLGPALLFLAFARAKGVIAGWLSAIGRVPMFYYVTHLFLLHALAVCLVWVSGGDVSFLFGEVPLNKPDGYGLSLPGVYLIALGVVVGLFPLGRRYAALKQRRSEWWWSYL